MPVYAPRQQHSRSEQEQEPQRQTPAEVRCEQDRQAQMATEVEKADRGADEIVDKINIVLASLGETALAA